MTITISGRLAEALRHSTVTLRSSSSEGDGTGSGVVLSDDSVITNAHVIAHSSRRVASGQEYPVESWEGRTVPGKLVRIDRARDLALLKAPGLNASAAQLGDSNLLRAGMPVIAVGNPLGFTGALSTGVIHSQSVAANGFGGPAIGAYRWVCADVRLAPGNSGGPLADVNGQVIGINTMVISGGLALAVPSRSVQLFLRPPVRIGVNARSVVSGILLLEVSPEGAAARASLLPGDVLTAINGVALKVAEDLQFALQGVETASVDFLRGGDRKLRHVVVQLVPQPAANAA